MVDPQVALFVHSVDLSCVQHECLIIIVYDSELQTTQIVHISLIWMTKMHSVLESSCVHDLSRLMVHNLSIHGTLGVLVLLLLPLLLLLLLR